MAKLAAAKLYSGVVLVARDGHPILDSSYGLADRQAGRPFTPQTRFYLAEVSRQFLAAAVLVLEQDGKLRVQDSICWYLPGCPRGWERITIHHLLTGSTGLPLDPRLGEPTSRPELLAALEQLEPLTAPGRPYWSPYATTDTLLAGFIVEAASGRPLGQFLQERIFAPAGMANSGYGDGGEMLAAGYLGSSRLPASTFESSPYRTTGGVYSTAEDLLRWDQALYTSNPLNEQSRKRMFAEYSPIPRRYPLVLEVSTHGHPRTTTHETAQYGYGWMLGTQQGHRGLRHAGWGSGFAVELSHYPDDNLTIILLANQQDVSRILGQLESELFRMAMGS
jgi:CubicO group peptidase (beta-lactamase class C family)